MTVLFFSLAIVGSAPALLSQSDYETCDATITGENRNRYVAGDISAECSAGWTPHGFGGPMGQLGGALELRRYQGRRPVQGLEEEAEEVSVEFMHDRPSKVSLRKLRLLQLREPHFAALRNDCTAWNQEDSHTCSGLPFSRPARIARCGTPWLLAKKMDFRVIESNYMEIKELDRPDGDSSVDRLEFPSTSITLRNCTEGGCTGGTTNWVDETSSEVEEAIVNAQLRMRVAVGQDNFCDIPY